MKFIGKLLLWLLVAAAIVIVLLYLVGQTRWAAGQIGNWVSGHSDYRLSLGKISHSWDEPAQIGLEDVALTRTNQPRALTAKRVVLGLSLRQLTNPRYFHSVTLHDGTLNVQPGSAALPIQADVLQLSNMALHAGDADWQLNAQRVNAGITPWRPQSGHLLGDNNRFQFSAGSLTLNGIPASQALVQGQIKDHQLLLEDFGADLAQGDLTGKATRAADGSWLVDRLRLNKVRLQTPLSLEQFWQRFTTLPPITLQRFDLIDARLEGKGWAFNDLDLSLQDVTLQQGDWRSENGVLHANASDIINGRFHLVDPIISTRLSPAGIAIEQFTSRWEGGLLRANGSWLRATKRLQLDDVTVAALEYTLPQNWRELWLKPLPAWLSQVYVNKLTTNRNLIIDINPAFPFQLTSLNGYGSNLLLAHDGQWGIWSGSLNLSASEATFNKIDVRRPSLALTADQRQIAVTELSAFMPNGLLDAKATVTQLPGKPFSLSLSGRSVPLNTLQQWGWQPVPLEGDGNLQLQVQGLLNSDGPFRDSVRGNLQATAKDGQTVNQQQP
ncbi:AsmA family protein [Serratia sp. Tan611]|uniref:AsmA family protein n=1 Tax=Serratia sp. Tan611 TaxID=2773264 RepID=UPI001934312F|nr:AsmA family protein [Serratia sp. Tan611]CAE1151662.1 AsmA family protein YicH [Serratia sp. Tan611]